MLPANRISKQGEVRLQMPDLSPFLAQIAENTAATAEAINNIQPPMLRDNSNASGLFAGADPYTVTASMTFADIHIQSDTLGSRQEYIK